LARCFFFHEVYRHSFVSVPGTKVLFCIWETRVQDFEAFVKATGHNAGEGWRDPGFAARGFNSDRDAVFSQTPLHPVTHVNWIDTEAFCRWLTEKERAAGNLLAGQEFNAQREGRAIRGASFNQGAPGRLVSSYRAPKSPGVRDINLGFRCVVTVGASSP
jgi:formylglycine-generating enzyme required for sulfatase activity